MIVSHKNQFVFFKPVKVAGSSVEVAISQHCGEEDILTGTNHFDELDSSDYEYPTRNNSIKRELVGDEALLFMKESGNIDRVTPDLTKSGITVEIFEPRFHMHALPSQVLDERTSSYKKITIVRNPWDMLVSFFWWSFYTSPAGYVDSKGVAKLDNSNLGFNVSSHPEAAPVGSDDIDTLRRKLEIFCQMRGDFRGPRGLEKNQNVLDWFVGISQEFYKIDYDIVLRHETLQRDYDQMCKTVKIPPETLPRLKSNQRKARFPHQDYSNEWTRSYVDSRFSMWLEKFEYTFD